MNWPSYGSRFGAKSTISFDFCGPMTISDGVALRESALISDWNMSERYEAWKNL
jgi:hypothetical protein